MSTFEILVIGIILMFVSAQCGAKIQKTVKFLYPVDPFTVSLMAACISVMIIQKPFEWFWYLPVIFGYILGFVIVGRTSYIMLRYLQPNIRHSDADPWVFYHDKNGNMCVQDQSWRQLLKRIFLGVHHYVLCDSDLAPNWVESTHHPFIPRFRIQVMYVEYLSTEEEEVCLKESRKLPKNGEKPRGLYVKQRISYIKAAHGSQVSLAELIADAGALDKANSRIEELEKEIYWLRKEATTVTTSLIGMFIKDNYAKSPLVLALSSRISRLNKKEEKNYNGGNTMRWLFGRQILGAKAPSGLHQKSNESKKSANDRVDMSLNRIYGDFTFLKDDADRKLKSFNDCGGQIIRDENSVTYKLGQTYITKILDDSGKTERFVYCTSDYSDEGEKVQEAAIADSDVAAYSYFRAKTFSLMMDFEKYRPEIGIVMNCAR